MLQVEYGALAGAQFETGFLCGEARRSGDVGIILRRIMTEEFTCGRSINFTGDTAIVGEGFGPRYGVLTDVDIVTVVAGDDRHLGKLS